MIVLVDVDHTISDAGWRDFLLGNWDRYHRAASDDDPIQEVIDAILAMQKAGARLFGLTARPGKYRAMTEKWLHLHGVQFDEMLMRDDEGFHPSPQMKMKLVLGRFPDLYAEPIIILDDREDVAEAFWKIGITVFQVHARKGKEHWA